MRGTPLVLQIAAENFPPKVASCRKMDIVHQAPHVPGEMRLRESYRRENRTRRV